MNSLLPRRPWWRRIRLSIRTLILLVLVVGGGLGVFVRRARVQRDAVRAIEAEGGAVQYDFQVSARGGVGGRTSPWPKWLVGLLGVDFFADVNRVTLGPSRTDSILAQVGRLRGLEHLDARKIPVTDAGFAHIAGLKALRTLGASEASGLTDAGLAHLSGLRRLESLYIEGPMNIEGPGLAHLEGLDRLRRLNIDVKTDAGLSSLSRLTGLKELMLGLTRVNDATLGELSRLTRLEELAFGADSGSDAEMRRLASLRNMKMLQVWGPWYTDAGLAPIAELGQLSTFFVSDTTSVTPEGLNRLQRERPALRLGVNGSGRTSAAHLNSLRAAIGPKSIGTGR
jgi:hypothetical protein